MTSLGTLSRLAASTLLVASAACADNITQAARQPVDDSPAPATSVSNTGAKQPTLVVTAKYGTAADFAGMQLSPGDRPGYFFRIDYEGKDFPVGANVVTRVYGVVAPGSRANPVFAIGVIPADGSVRGIYSSSCPTGFTEMYVVELVNGRTIESNHVS
ncbi:MAG TPA: hypothetical protein VF488_07270, partial [Gemmatimonadaceae bacterium]